MTTAHRVGAALLLVLGGARTARADDTSDIESILSQPVITTASTTAQKASEAPALSMTVTSEDLRTFGLRTLAEAVNFLSLGVVTADPLRTPDIGGRGVMFAGDNGKHFLLLINGHALNDPLYGAARFDEGAGVPIDLIDHIEVIVGPGSVLYGSNAMTGVINVITKNAAEYQGVHLTSEYEFGRSARASAGGGVSFKLFGVPSEVTAAVEYAERSGPEFDFAQVTLPSAIGTLTRNSSFGPSEPGPNVWGGHLARAYYAQAPSGMLRFRAGEFEVNVVASSYRRSIPYATAVEAVLFDDPRNDEMDRAVRLDVRHQATLSRLLSLSSRAYADSVDYQRHAILPGPYCLRGTVPACEYYDAGLARWVGLEERLSFNWLHDQSLVTMIGVDARDQHVSAKEDSLNASEGGYFGPSTGHIDTGAALIAPYVQQTWSPEAHLDLNAGARLDADTRFSPVLSPRAAAAFRPWDKGTLKAIYSQAFRAPTWSETGLGNYETAPADDVQPEIVRSVEGSFEQRFGTQRVIFGAFRSSWDNLIEATPLSPAERSSLQLAGRIPSLVTDLVRYRNIAHVANYGWNGGWEGSLAEGRLRYGLNATGAVSRLDAGAGAVPLPVAPQVFGNVHVAYALGGGAPTAALAGTFMGPRVSDRPQLGQFPASSTPLADLRVTLTGPVPFVRGLAYRGSAEYLTASHGPYTAGPSPIASGGITANVPTGFAPIDQFRAFVGLRYDFAERTSDAPSESP